MYKIFPKETQEVAQVIGEFYLQKNNGDYEATAKELTNLGITDIEVEFHTVIVELSRPGLFIGKKGENCEKLESFLKERGYGKLSIKEAKQNILDFLIPIDLREFELDDMYQDFDDIDWQDEMEYQSEREEMREVDLYEEDNEHWGTIDEIQGRFGL